jgi:hypothetical protein
MVDLEPVNVEVSGSAFVHRAVFFQCDAQPGPSQHLNRSPKPNFDEKNLLLIA